MSIITLNNRAINRSDTATSGQVFTATSATAADFQDAAGGDVALLTSGTLSSASSLALSSTYITSTYQYYDLLIKYIPNFITNYHDMISNILLNKKI